MQPEVLHIHITYLVSFTEPMMEATHGVLSAMAMDFPELIQKLLASELTHPTATRFGLRLAA